MHLRFNKEQCTQFNFFDVEHFQHYLKCWDEYSLRVNPHAHYRSRIYVISILSTLIYLLLF